MQRTIMLTRSNELFFTQNLYLHHIDWYVQCLFMVVHDLTTLVIIRFQDLGFMVNSFVLRLMSEMILQHILQEYD